MIASSGAAARASTSGQRATKFLKKGAAPEAVVCCNRISEQPDAIGVSGLARRRSPRQRAAVCVPPGENVRNHRARLSLDGGRV